MRFVLGLTTLSLLAAACEGAAGKDGAAANVSVVAEPAGSNCAHGGVAVKTSVGDGGVVATSYVCNGADGQQVTAVVEPAGGNCPDGGVKVQVGTSVPMYVCGGSDGQSVVATVEVAGTNCAAGGLKVQVGGGAPSYVCNGAGVIVSLVSSADTTSCPAGQGGIKVQVGSATPSYVCNGASGLATWSTITASTTAQANHAYVASGAAAITLTLPESSALQVGDGIKLLVDGTGLVSVAPRGGQSFHYRGGELAFATTWTMVGGANHTWTALASSADGKKLVATSDIDGIYTSADSGVTWTKTSAPAYHWYGLASSADGTQLVAASYALGGTYNIPGAVYRSADSGATWTLTSAPNGSEYMYLSMVSSADGSKLAAGANNGMFVSTDSGATWTLGLAGAYGPLASSSDGMKLVTAYAGGSADIHVSTDAGLNWTRTSAPAAPAGMNWGAVTSSADGTKLFAADWGGGIWASTDSGGSWAKSSAPSNSFVSMASSADGTKLVALASAYNPWTGGIYTSTDSGATWTKNTGPASGQTVISSTDGSVMVVCSYTGMYRRGSSALVAHQSAVLDLTYIGNGVFFVTDVEGTVEEPLPAP